jgi:hypothetical protein
VVQAWREEDGANRVRRWESVVDQAIREAQARGEFDDLPGHGRPLRLDENPLAGDREMGFRVLKNAGILPEWMELEKELRAEEADLQALKERTARWLREEAARSAADRETAGEAAGRGSRTGGRVWWPFGRSRREAASRPIRPRFSAAAIEAERRRARQAYLDRAARFDEQVVRYNNALPNELRWRQRARVVAAQAAAVFDAACPPVPSATDRIPDPDPSGG